MILKWVMPLLVLPFLTSLLVRYLSPRLHRRLEVTHDLSFYLWAIALAIVTAKTVNEIVQQPAVGLTEIWIALGALGVCCGQFFIGKKIGGWYGERITCGQALGQKNTILAIWIAHTYLTPISSIAAGSYVAWQNIINSWQLWHHRKEVERRAEAGTLSEMTQEK
jgi:BASS family bile acid:Na+ symporter